MLANQKVITLYKRRMKGFKSALGEDIAEYEDKGKAYVLNNSQLSLGAFINGVATTTSVLKGTISESIHNINIGDKVSYNNQVFYVQSVVEIGIRKCELVCNG